MNKLTLAIFMKYKPKMTRGGKPEGFQVKVLGVTLLGIIKGEKCQHFGLRQVGGKCAEFGALSKRS